MVGVKSAWEGGLGQLVLETGVLGQGERGGMAVEEDSMGGPAEGDQTGLVVGDRLLRWGLGQEGERFTDLDQAAVIPEKIPILLFLVPQHPTAAVRIPTAGEAHFVPVINKGHTGEQELEGGHQFQLALVAAAAVERSGGVVAAQQVPQEGMAGGVQIAPEEAQLVQKSRSGEGAFRYKVHGGVQEGVVHDAVPGVALEEVRGVMPDFAYDQGFRELCFDGGAEPSPEGVGDFVAHVQPPSVDLGGAEPVEGHVDEVTGGLLVLQVDLGHTAEVAEAFIIGLFHRDAGMFRLAVGIIPVSIGGMLPVFLQVLEGEEFRGGVVEHCVQYHPQAQGVGFIHQVDQVLFGAKVGVDGVVVYGIVFMGGVGAEDRSHVQDIHAQIHQVIQVGGDTLQIALEIRVAVDRGFVPELGIHILAGGEAGGEDLIDDLVLGPLGDDEALHFPLVLGKVIHPVDVCGGLGEEAAVAVIGNSPGLVGELEEVAQADHVDGQLRFVIVVTVVLGYPVHLGDAAGIHESHREVFILGVQLHVDQVVPPGLEAEEESAGFDAVAVPAVGHMGDGSTVHNGLLYG